MRWGAVLSCSPDRLSRVLVLCHYARLSVSPVVDFPIRYGRHGGCSYLSCLARQPSRHLYLLGRTLPRSPRCVIVDLSAYCCGTWIALASTRTRHTAILFVKWKLSRWHVKIIDRHPRLRQAPSRGDTLVLATRHQLDKKESQGYLVKNKNCVPRSLDVDRKPSSCLRLSRRISQGKLIRILVN
jgi:hypothetical protein